MAGPRTRISGERPDEPWFVPQGGAAARYATRAPPGHPQGYVEAFEQLWRDAALPIHASDAGEPPPESRPLTTVDDGLRLVAAMLASGAADSTWQPAGRADGLMAGVGAGKGSRGCVHRLHVLAERTTAHRG